MVLSENIDKNAEIAGDGEKMDDNARLMISKETIDTLFLSEYRQLVDKLFADKSPILIPNCSIEHATIINELIIKHTPEKGEVYFYSDSFDKQCFDNEDFLKEVKAAIDRDVIFHLACTGNVRAQEFPKLFEKPIRNNVSKIFIKDEKGVSVPINFSTNGTAVRLEKNTNRFEADVSGNDPQAAMNLVQAFETVWSRR